MHILQEYSNLLEGYGLYLLTTLLLLVLYEVVYYLVLCITLRHDVIARQKEQLGVSVIVCAHNEEENLRDYLHTLLNQDYPKYEVIVVDDGSEDNSQTILKQYAREYDNLYLTFVPNGARVISSKKLALTIGIKASHYDYILLTDADCRPESRKWISEMMSGFSNEKTELVLGFSPYFNHHGWLSNMISYDTLVTGMQYLTMARHGHAYMGVGRNMAYRKQTFFDHNGFQGLLNERAGDDDLFVNKITTRSNTAVVCSKDSLTWSAPKRTWREWVQQKRRHLSVSSHYNLGNKLRVGVEPLMRGLMYGIIIVCIVHGGLYAFIALILWALRLAAQLIAVNICAKRWGMQGFGLNIILHDIFLPLMTLYILLTKQFYKQKIYW